MARSALPRAKNTVLIRPNVVGSWTADARQLQQRLRRQRAELAQERLLAT